VGSRKAQQYPDLPLEDGRAALTPSESARAPVLGLAGGQWAEDAAPSPARRLQDELSSRLWGSDAQPDQVAGKWSPRARLLFMLGTCGAFWAAVYAATSLLSRR
jgi:hypothetical protein